MKASEMIESNYLNAKTAEQLKGQTFTIYEVKNEVIGKPEDAKHKMVIGFEGVEKGMIANKTNIEILIEAFGDETDDWIGKSVILNIVQVTFNGQRTPSIQLSPVVEPSPKKGRK